MARRRDDGEEEDDDDGTAARRRERLLVAVLGVAMVYVAVWCVRNGIVSAWIGYGMFVCFAYFVIIRDE